MPRQKIRQPGTQIRRSVVGASPSSRRGNARERPSHALKLTEKARKIATPPSRGRGDPWIWRPCCGRDTHPRRAAMSRTWRVATNDTANENAKSPKNRSVKSKLLFRLKQPAFQSQARSTDLTSDEVFLPRAGNS